MKATKLRHYAKTTSPSSRTLSQPTSLLVSILLSSLPSYSPTPPAPSPSNKPRKATALSHFATKKRALTRSPSASSIHDSSSMSSYTPPESSDASDYSVGSKVSGAMSRGGGRGGRSQKNSRKTGKSLSVANTPDQETNTTDELLSVATEHCNGSASGKVLDASLLEHKPRRNPVGFKDDDEMSIASSNITTSSGNSVASGGTVGKSRQKTVGKRKGQKSTQNELQRINANFSLESLFSYYPPTLTVRHGELVPLQSLSVKNLDRSSLPSSHPIDRWSLGQPVKVRWREAAAGPKTKRMKRHGTGNRSGKT